ncbi:hypothetical protein PSP31121_05243 [Pandoraea sputorum]|uniref:Uncharacterized protein n=1 Tax=Pandoraea sputorum TaxID=93222 RepID=A0A5E5BK59_9BURK|nr:hypothetical protein PSP31121_05243 [Pandoraea sputorum]
MADSARHVVPAQPWTNQTAAPAFGRGFHPLRGQSPDPPWTAVGRATWRVQCRNRAIPLRTSLGPGALGRGARIRHGQSPRRETPNTWHHRLS